MQYAEYISFINGYYKISVISGIGVRNYYRKLGYGLQDTFMVKTIFDLNFMIAYFFLIVAFIYNVMM